MGWTREGILQLKALRAQGLGFHQIAAITGRPIATCQQTYSRWHDRDVPETWDSVGGHWTPDMDARLRELRALGLSGSQIGKLMGFSRSAIIARLNRLKVMAGEKENYRHRHRVPAKAPPKPITLAPQSPPSLPKRITLPIDTPKPLPRATITMKAVDEKALPYGVTLMDRDPCGCAWPINDGGPYLFCNQPRVGGKSYCVEHVAMLRHHGGVGMTKPEWVADQHERRRTARLGLQPA